MTPISSNLVLVLANIAAGLVWKFFQLSVLAS